MGPRKESQMKPSYCFAALLASSLILFGCSGASDSPTVPSVSQPPATPSTAAEQDVPTQTIAAVSNRQAAATRTDVIYRGQEKGWFIDPGRTLVVFYSPGGRSSTVQWQQPPLSYVINGRPFVTGSIYWYPNPTTWKRLYTGSVDCFWQSFSLPYGGGAYKFEIKCYAKGAQVKMKVY